MPTSLHEIYVDLLRADPQLILEWLAPLVGADVVDVEFVAADFPQHVPPARMVDLALLVRLAHGGTLGALVEVQLGDDPDKRLTLPFYAVAMRARHRCPVVVVALCPDGALAEKLARPIELGPGNEFRVFVIGPSTVPVVRDPDSALRTPIRAALSALTHPTDVDAVFAGLVGASRLSEEQGAIVCDMILNILDGATRAALEALMSTQRYEYKSDLFRKSFEDGRREGETQGEARGEAVGRALGRAESILAVLAARGLQPSAEVVERIRTSRDLAELDRWLRRAATCASVDELFE